MILSFFFVKQKTAYEMRISDWSSDVCSSDLQQAIAAMTLTQQAKAALTTDANGELKPTTAFIDGVRKFALSVTDLDIDLIDRVNPFSATYAVLAKAMDAKTLLQVQDRKSTRLNSSH